MERREDGSYVGAITDENVRAIFREAGDFNRRILQVGGHTLYLYAIDGLTSGGDISDYVVKPLLQDTHGKTMEELFSCALHAAVYNAVAQECKDLNDLSLKLVNGFAVVIFGERALAFEAKTPEKRSPSAPEVENTVKGPKDAFTETVRTNTSLLRRHLRSPALRLYETQVGRRSLTNVTVAYVEGLTDPGLVERMKERLSKIDIDGLVSPSSVEEYVTGSRPTAFPLLQYTERTDRFAQGLLDGRVGLLVDGLPLGYLAPVDLGYFMSSPEDRGVDFLSASFLRILRYAALLISLFLPALYVAMAAFHPQMLPTPLLHSIIESKQSVPFPTIFEVLGLLCAFELLQEASIALPSSIGQSLSIIGGLVVGSAAVEAKIISPVALIIVAVAGICGFAMPGRSFAAALRLWRLLLAVLASLGGLFGLTLGALCLLIHLAGLDSLGVSYLAPFSRVKGASALIRSRLIKQVYRDPELHPLDERNQK
ncbi:MAG: spore germination protein [Oscillospiraceae bacterium]|nr:spore germination protein [Oscillospiraceae bacterium]